MLFPRLPLIHASTRGEGSIIHVTHPIVHMAPSLIALSARQWINHENKRRTQQPRMNYTESKMNKIISLIWIQGTTIVASAAT